MTTLSSRLEKNWLDIIGGEFDKPYMLELEKFLQREKNRGRTYPKDQDIFNALNLTPFKKIKVVIIGQDPYHEEGQAHGLCFSVPNGTCIPPSLKNIYKEIEAEYHIEMPPHGDLTGWAEQGVLLLNAALTVRRDEAGSHQGKGWEKLTDAVIRAVNEKPEPVVFMLWGRCAQKKRPLLKDEKHLVLEASHPSPFSVGRCLRDGEIHSFRGCGHFRAANAHLKKNRLERIDWQDLGKGRKAVGTSV
ncbi:MAG: uracil-DNA glycosylase [Candidatus Sulfotelmatobacter sp.]|jgi:uracil-DNA glycosylase